MKNVEIYDILDLLTACDEICLEDLLEELQKFLIIRNEDWIEKSLIDVYKFLSKNDRFVLLKDFCLLIIEEEFQKFLNFDVKENENENLFCLNLSHAVIKNEKRIQMLDIKSRNMIRYWLDPESPFSNKLKLVFCNKNEKMNLFSDYKKKYFNKKRNLIVMKIKGAEELIGGYSSIGWWDEKKNNFSDHILRSNKNFIFKIDLKKPENSILSKVKAMGFSIRQNRMEKKFTGAVIENEENKPKLNLRFLIDFYDLTLFVDDGNENIYYGSYWHERFASYEKDLEIKQYGLFFSLEYLEIYELICNNS